MNISKSQVEQILKTLPIGYYCKRDVKIFLTDEQGSYYNIMNDEIYISYPMIENVAKSLTSNNLEDDVRCLLYHELSHAYLTPKDLTCTDIINVFEDERIESILRNYYKNVNFREFVKRVNNFQNEQPTSAFNLYYQIVRYRIGPTEFLNRVSEIIKENVDLNCSYWYEYQIDQLYKDIEKYFNENSNKSKQQSNSNESNTNSNEHQTNSNMSNIEQFNSNEENVQSSQTYIEETFSESEAKEYIRSISEKYDSNELNESINKILSSVKKTNKTNGSAINAYSGVFNPRSVIRDDYKFFVQQNRSGHVKQYSKIHLNLFIDESGSFSGNDNTVNKLLKTLIRFEKSNSDFSFDLISCSYGQRIRRKDDRIQKSEGGTLISDTIFEQYRKVQQTNASNINIVLYDGDACEGARYNREKYERCSKNFKCFDNRNCILILDSRNERHIKHCSSAKVIITNKYTLELQKNVLLALQALTR